MRHQAGLTLLELLLVVFILSVISFGAVSLIDSSDSQWRFEETKSRLARIRVAVVGEGEPVYAGQRRLSGFVADVGDLPTDAADLTGPLAAGDTAYQSQTPELEDGYQLSAHALFKGRRPPYLVLEASTDPSNPRYRDGWGTKSTANDALLHGWGWTVASETLTVVSLGADGQTGAPAGGAYDADISATIAKSEWGIEGGIQVEVRNSTTGDIANLRVDLLLYADGSWSQVVSARQSIPTTASRTFQITDFVPAGTHLLVLMQDADATAGNGERPYGSSPFTTSLIEVYPGVAPALIQWEVK
jgi:prepilin-type N-terminal cleavage/methylation domain-containing protein